MVEAQPIDQGAVLRSGQAAVPNYAEQALQRAMLAVNQQNAETASINARSLAGARQREADRLDAFGQAVEAMGPNPTAQQLAMLAYRFPEFSEAMRRGWQTMDEGTRRTDFQQVANITAAARGGNFELAARLMRQRVEADRAAGQEDATDTAILAALENPNPGQRQFAVDLLERATAAADPERYAQTYGTFQRNVSESNGIYYDTRTGQVVGQDPRGRIIPGSNGSFYGVDPIEGVPSITQGGGLTGQQRVPSNAPEIVQGMEDRGEIGPDDDVEFIDGRPVPIRREAPAFRVAPPGVASLPTGSPLDGQMSGGVDVVRVRSVQEANRLPPGTRYMTPNGAVYVR